ncbi:hypothetical protein [Streptosporangium minutum]|nr:hypothetical protein [Streptosporangium minutum]
MLGRELVVILGAAVPAGNGLARRLRIAPPVLPPLPLTPSRGQRRAPAGW